MTENNFLLLLFMSALPGSDGIAAKSLLFWKQES